MRQFFLLTVFFSFAYCSGKAQFHSEGELTGKLFSCLQYKDYDCYKRLFPKIDSLASWVLQYADNNSESYRKMYYLRENPASKKQFQESIDKEINENFSAFFEKSKTLNIHWGETVFVRYELEKVSSGGGLINEKIAPLRFLGYVFFKDMLTQETFAFTVYDMMQVNGNWYGGGLTNIFEADTKEKYRTALITEMKQKRLGINNQTTKKDHATTEEEEDVEKPSSLKQVAERKFYKGKFDNEISVQLYVRYIKGGCPEGICSWEALFKFGDDDFQRVKVTKTEDGKWHFFDEQGGMDLVLNGEIYTGIYALDSDKTEYEVKFKENPLLPKKLQLLDELLEQ